MISEIENPFVWLSLDGILFPEINPNIHYSGFRSSRCMKIFHIYIYSSIHSMTLKNYSTRIWGAEKRTAIVVTIVKVVNIIRQNLQWQNVQGVPKNMFLCLRDLIFSAPNCRKWKNFSVLPKENFQKSPYLWSKCPMASQTWKHIFGTTCIFYDLWEEGKCGFNAQHILQ